MPSSRGGAVLAGAPIGAMHHCPVIGYRFLARPLKAAGRQAWFGVTRKAFKSRNVFVVSVGCYLLDAVLESWSVREDQHIGNLDDLD